MSDVLTADIGSLLRGYEPMSDVSSLRKGLRLLDGPDPAWMRSAFRPGHFTASGFVASPDGGSLLLIRHARLGRWLQPGGHFEESDSSVEEAARREVLEETGVGDLSLVGAGLIRVDVHPIPARVDEPAHFHFDLGMGFIATDWVIGPVDEVLDARWVGFDDVGDYDLDAAALGGAMTLHRRLSDR